MIIRLTASKTLLLLCSVLLSFSSKGANDKAQANSYDNTWETQWVNHSRQILSAGSGKTAGFVLQIGDSITHSNPYSQWPRYGAGKTAEDQALCSWISSSVMGSGTGDTSNKNGFYLAITDTSGGRGMTASSGISANELLSGSGNGGNSMPSDTNTSSAKTKIADGATYSGNIHIDTLLAAFADAQFAVIMLGTNDANGGRTSNAFIADLTSIVDKIEARNIVPILSTIPPTTAGGAASIDAFNSAIRSLAQTRGLPLIDYHAEIVARRSGTSWQNTLISGDGIHPSANNGGTYDSASDPYAGGGDAASHRTGTPCSDVGYLLRSWLTIQKLKEVKSYVIDGNNPPSSGVNSIEVTPQNTQVAAGGSQTFSAVAKDANGSPVVPQPVFTWLTNGGGNVSSSGQLTASTTAGGPFTVTASASGKSGSASFTVTALTQVDSVSVTPSSRSILAGQSFHFSAVAKDVYGNTITNAPGATWSISGGGTVDSSGTVTAGTSTGGPFTVSATINGKIGNASFTVFEQNSAPTIDSSPVVTPNPASTGALVTFTVFASDSDSDALSYTWRFGDGSSSTENPAQHVYTAAGDYIVLATATDPHGAYASKALVITILEPNPADLDDDGDGFSNGVENSAGTNALSAQSYPGGPGDFDGDGIPDDQDADDDNDGASDAVEAAQGTDPWNAASVKRLPLTVLKLSGSCSVAVGKDSLSFSGKITQLPPGFSLIGTSAELRVGAASVPLTFDSRGRAKSSQASFSVLLKPMLKDKLTKQLTFAGGDASFKATLSRGTWAQAWGFDLNSSNSSLILPITLMLGGYIHSADVQTTLAIKPGKQIRFKK